jgi:hypothetical protein
MKEAYKIASQHNKTPQAQIWLNIWKQSLWPKVSTFLWLIALNKALTWDNLCKQGTLWPLSMPSFPDARGNN